MQIITEASQKQCSKWPWHKVIITTIALHTQWFLPKPAFVTYTQVRRKGGPLALIQAMVVTLYRAGHQTILGAAHGIWSLCVNVGVYLCACIAGISPMCTTERGACMCHTRTFRCCTDEKRVRTMWSVRSCVKHTFRCSIFLNITFYQSTMHHIPEKKRHTSPFHLSNSQRLTWLFETRLLSPCSTRCTDSRACRLLFFSLCLCRTFWICCVWSPNPGCPVLFSLHSFTSFSSDTVSKLL